MFNIKYKDSLSFPALVKLSIKWENLLFVSSEISKVVHCSGSSKESDLFLVHQRKMSVVGGGEGKIAEWKDDKACNSTERSVSLSPCALKHKLVQSKSDMMTATCW